VKQLEHVLELPVDVAADHDGRAYRLDGRLLRQQSLDAFAECEHLELRDALRLLLQLLDVEVEVHAPREDNLQVCLKIKNSIEMGYLQRLNSNIDHVIGQQKYSNYREYLPFASFTAACLRSSSGASARSRATL